MNSILNLIDHTVLKAETVREDVVTLCKEAKEYGFKAVCVNPFYIEEAKKILKDTDVKVATVIGFPLGANTSEVKAFETEDAIKKGADEVDMVINIAALKNMEYDLVLEDIKAVVDASNKRALVKVIIETCLLTDQEKIKACELSMEAGADYVKTSTGFSTAGATVEDIKIMKSVVGDKLGIKASGGVRDLEFSRALVEAGATRLGASAGVEIAKELK